MATPITEYPNPFNRLEPLHPHGESLDGQLIAFSQVQSLKDTHKVLQRHDDRGVFAAVQQDLGCGHLEVVAE